MTKMLTEKNGERRQNRQEKQETEMERHRDTGTRRCGEDRVDGGDTEERRLSSVTGTQSLLTNNTQPPYNINNIGLS